MSAEKPPYRPSIRNVVETPWQQFPGHYGGALSKPLVRPETTGSRRVDLEIDGKTTIVRKHDVIFIPPGVRHSIRNDGLGDLTFIVVTTPVEDR